MRLVLGNIGKGFHADNSPNVVRMTNDQGFVNGAQLSYTNSSGGGAGFGRGFGNITGNHSGYDFEYPFELIQYWKK